MLKKNAHPTAISRLFRDCLSHTGTSRWSAEQATACKEYDQWPPSGMHQSRMSFRCHMEEIDISNNLLELDLVQSVHSCKHRDILLAASRGSIGAYRNRESSSHLPEHARQTKLDTMCLLCVTRLVSKRLIRSCCEEKPEYPAVRFMHITSLSWIPRSSVTVTVASTTRRR